MHEGFNQHLEHSSTECVCCHYIMSIRLLWGEKTCVVKSGSGEVSYDVIGIFQGEMLRTLAGDRNGGDEKWLMSTYSINIKA